jgi:hypothetical protein
MNSTISGEQFFIQNDAIFMEALIKIDPQLVMIRNYLNYTQINPDVLPPILDQLSLLLKGGGYGQVVIEVVDGKVTYCRSIGDRKVDLDLISK